MRIINTIYGDLKMKDGDFDFDGYGRATSGGRLCEPAIINTGFMKIKIDYYIAFLRMEKQAIYTI